MWHHSPMYSISNEKEPLVVPLYYLYLVLIVDMVTPLPRTLESILPSVDQSESLDMYFFQIIILSFDE
jgi:hypothetical protein